MRERGTSADFHSDEGYFDTKQKRTEMGTRAGNKTRTNRKQNVGRRRTQSGE